MYYDLICSLPHLPHFTRAERLPITELRLKQRLRLLKPAHAEQLARAVPLVRWRGERLMDRSDAQLAGAVAALMDAPLERPLREYVGWRMEQQTLLAALRRRQAGLALADGAAPWGVGPRVHWIRRHAEEPDFRLAHVHPWLARARELLAAGDARGLEQLLMQAAWSRLDQCAQQRMFGFEAVFAYVFQWDMARAWLACNVDQATTRFRELIGKVTHVEPS